MTEPAETWDNWDRGWTTDADGNRVRVGLTLAETAEYAEMIRAHRAMEEFDASRYLELHGRHERARLQVVAAEIERRGISRPH